MVMLINNDKLSEIKSTALQIKERSNDLSYLKI
jgi:hypothetical protein